MKKTVLVILFLSAKIVFAQREYKTWFKPVTAAELNMKNYSKDTSAAAVVLSEIGTSTFEITSNEFKLVFNYHARIKIFRNAGFDAGTVLIPLNIREGDHEGVADLKAETFNLAADGSVQTAKLSLKDTYLENQSPYRDQLKFTFPNLHEGSVIEYSYRIYSPFLYNLRPWTFQSDIPKIHCEYQTEIPEIFTYNQHLTGYLSLSKMLNNVNVGYYDIGDRVKYDQTRTSFFMEDVPAFKKESFMADSRNYISSMQFQLATIRPGTSTQKEINKDWTQSVHEMFDEPRFGVQINRARGLFTHKTDSIKNYSADRLTQAKAFYTFIKSAAACSKGNTMYSNKGIRSAFEKKSGNTAEFNLALIGGLQAMGLKAEAVILSTRDNPYPNIFYPNLEDFNYVICQLKIDSTAYLLDASSKDYEFGVIPPKCINGNGRILRRDFSSDWVELKTPEGDKRIGLLALNLQSDGKITGKFTAYFYGHAALLKREEIRSFSSQDDYLDDLSKVFSLFRISDFQLLNKDEPDKVLTEIVTLESLGAGIKLREHFKPFFLRRFKQSPFISNERLYPVDMISPVTEMLNVQFHYPANFKISGLPVNQVLRLPGGGGRYILQAEDTDHTITIGNQLILTRPFYTTGEYGNLKEFFRRVVQAQTSDFVVEKIN